MKMSQNERFEPALPDGCVAALLVTHNKRGFECTMVMNDAIDTPPKVATILMGMDKTLHSALDKLLTEIFKGEGDEDPVD